MEVRQYMTPEGLLELVLQDGALVCVEEKRVMDLSGRQAQPQKSASSVETDTKAHQLHLRLPTLKLVRVCSARHDERK